MLPSYQPMLNDLAVFVCWKYSALRLSGLFRDAMWLAMANMLENPDWYLAPANPSIADHMRLG